MEVRIIRNFYNKEVKVILRSGNVLDGTLINIDNYYISLVNEDDSYCIHIEDIIAISRSTDKIQNIDIEKEVKKSNGNNRTNG